MNGPIAVFDPKDPDATARLEFVFGLPSGVTLSTPTWSVDEMPARDAEHPLVLSGAAFLSPVANIVAAGGVIGRYRISCIAPASNGETFVRSGYLDLEET